MARAYTKEELLRFYRESTSRNINALTPMLKKTLVPFVIVDIITEVEKLDWQEEDRRNDTDTCCERVVSRVQERSDVDVFLKFSRALSYCNKIEVQRIYGFIPDLMEVGLHDPLQGKEEEKLEPRQPSSKPVVLWIVKDESMFSLCESLIIEPEKLQRFKGYEVLKSCSLQYFDLYVVHSKSAPKAPGRKFDVLLATFEPCPTLLVYSGECQPGDGDSELAKNSVILASSPWASKFDFTAEASHVAELCRLQGDHNFTNADMHVRRATRYVSENGSTVHCPDAVSLFSAAKRCEIPSVAIAQVLRSDEERNNTVDQNTLCNYVYQLIKNLVR